MVLPVLVRVEPRESFSTMITVAGQTDPDTLVGIQVNKRSEILVLKTVKTDLNGNFTTSFKIHGMLPRIYNVFLTSSTGERAIRRVVTRG